MSEFAIDVSGLTKTFNHEVAVDHLDLKVHQGSIFGFLGSNGSGKTTTIRMLCGLLTPTAGQGRCLGYDIITQSDEIKKHVGYMPQQFSYYKGLTVEQNLRFVADIYQIKSPQTAIDSIIDDLDLGHYRHFRAESLSGGWKQRLSLACCLLHQPQLVFLDEPTAGIDPKARKEFWDYLHKRSIEHGTTILVTTHYMDEAEKCTHLAYIYSGKLLYTGPTNEILPYSQVKTYVFEGKREEQVHIISLVEQSYPKILSSIVNNELRLSSRDHEALEHLINSQPQDKFHAAIPSFEEVFIGLIT
jgi:ABC-2 type transport system ATP-binding protein